MHPRRLVVLLLTSGYPYKPHTSTPALHSIMVMAGAMVASAAAAAAEAAAAILALTMTTQHDRLGEECDAVVAPAAATAAQECAVCLCELAGAAGCSEPEAAAAAVRTLPVCGHGFHAECIGRWLPLRAECPICRRPVITGADGGGVPVDVAEAAPAAAWSRAARMACGFGDGRVVWTRSPSA